VRVTTIPSLGVLTGAGLWITTKCGIASDEAMMAAIDAAMCELLHTCLKKFATPEQTGRHGTASRSGSAGGRSSFVALGRLRSCWPYFSSLGLAGWLCQSTQRGDRPYWNRQIGKAALPCVLTSPPLLKTGLACGSLASYLDLSVARERGSLIKTRTVKAGSFGRYSHRED
jgi:hypothetical protein